MKFVKNSACLNSIRRMLSLALVLAMLTFAVSCTKNKAGDNSKSKNNTSSATADGSSSDNTESKENKASSAYVSKSGISDYGEFDASLTTEFPRSDANEVKCPDNCAVLMSHLTGLASDSAEKLRQEILNTPNTAEIYKSRITGKIYYVSPGGNDENDGLSPNKALRTTDALNSLSLVSGDAVLFERNSIFRISGPIVAVKGVTYGSYGQGDKPKIFASPANYAKEKWIPTKKRNVWQAVFGYDRAGGLVLEHGAEVGKCVNGGLIALNSNTQFYHDYSNGLIYMYCDKGNPAKVYSSIEFMPRTFIFNILGGTSGVTVDNLCLKYSAYIAVNCVFKNDNITVTNCEVGYIGGTNYGVSGRMGNAIETWAANTNLHVDHNWVYQTFDTAISWQGLAGEGDIYKDISFCNNLLEYNNADFEFFDEAGSEVENFKISGNIMRFTCMGWGTRTDDGGIRGIEGCIRANTVPMSVKNITVTDNIIDCPARQVINWMSTPEQLPQIKASGTKVYIKSGYRAITEVVRGLQKATTEPVSLYGTNLAEFKAAFNRFDPAAVIVWK